MEGDGVGDGGRWGRRWKEMEGGAHTVSGTQ